MKTTISVPDYLLRSADALARKLGISRSRLVAEAVAEYVAKHKHARVTERLNQVYAAEDGSLDPAVREATRQTLRRVEFASSRL